MLLLSAVFGAAALTIGLLYFIPAYRHFILPAQLILLVLGLTILLVLLKRVYKEVLKPMDSIRTWASRMRQGDYTADISLPVHGEFAGLLQDLTNMGRWYKDLGPESDDSMSEQVRQMARKTRLLEILYDIAATISASHNLNEVLKRFLKMLVELTNAKMALVRLSTAEGDMELIDSIGCDQGQLQKIIPVSNAIPGNISRVRSLYVTEPGKSTDFSDAGNTMDSMECIIVPLIHQGEVMGSYHFLVDQKAFNLSYDLHEMLTSTGYHLGLAVHKSHLDEEARQQSIFRERLTLAHELHDSLAQSMASLRFQCKALEDSVKQSDREQATHEISRLRQGVDKANTELRELMVHFRAPVDSGGLVPVLQDMLRKFGEEHEILAFTQFDCGDINLPTYIQRQVLRISQEALANISKHANAHVVRLLLKSYEDGQCQLLIEDDGHGFESTYTTDSGVGERIGLKVMQERAAYINGGLTVESEPGEGTRVELSFRWDTQI